VLVLGPRRADPWPASEMAGAVEIEALSYAGLRPTAGPKAALGRRVWRTAAIGSNLAIEWLGREGLESGAQPLLDPPRERCLFTAGVQLMLVSFPMMHDK
jgi:hypothetical protein